MITVRIDDAELRTRLVSLRSGTSSVLRQAIEAGAEVIRQAANSMAPGPHVETAPGKITPTSAEVLIGPDKAHWYYQFFETGATRHEIDGKTKKALAFAGAEGEKIVRQVDHPGLAARPFLRPALDNARTPAVDAVGEELRRAIARAAMGKLGG